MMVVCVLHIGGCFLQTFFQVVYRKMETGFFCTDVGVVSFAVF